jgi:hypothetical protein
VHKVNLGSMISMDDNLAPVSPDPAGLVWLEGILSPVTEVSIFGGSILFSVVVGEQTHAGARRFHDQLPTFLALAWFFFVLALGLAIATKMALSFNRDRIKMAFARHNPNQMQPANVQPVARNPEPFLDEVARTVIVKAKIADLMCLLILLAFFFLSLCVAAYDATIGSLAAGCTGLLWLVFCITWAYQNMPYFIRATVHCLRRQEQN